MTRLGEFRQWIAHPTTPFFIYWKGFLLLDKERSLMLDNLPFIIRNDEAIGLAKEALWAEQEGKVYLLQKRHAPSQYEYRAYQRRHA